jgi:hypothetical protein
MRYTHPDGYSVSLQPSCWRIFAPGICRLILFLQKIETCLTILYLNAIKNFKFYWLVSTEPKIDYFHVFFCSYQIFSIEKRFGSNKLWQKKRKKERDREERKQILRHGVFRCCTPIDGRKSIEPLMCTHFNLINQWYNRWIRRNAIRIEKWTVEIGAAGIWVFTFELVIWFGNFTQ